MKAQIIYTTNMIVGMRRTTHPHGHEGTNVKHTMVLVHDTLL